jgi:AbrB family looped-hinge helix DNA binding protein
MADVTLSSKNQITIPVGMVRSLGLEAGDKLVVMQSGDHLALFPKPADFADYIVGSMKGFWGSKEQIDRYVDDLRAGPGARRGSR